MHANTDCAYQGHAYPGLDGLTAARFEITLIAAMALGFDFARIGI